jgi:hypothetical protein
VAPPPTKGDNVARAFTEGSSAEAKEGSEREGESMAEKRERKKGSSARKTESLESVKKEEEIFF